MSARLRFACGACVVAGALSLVACAGASPAGGEIRLRTEVRVIRDDGEERLGIAPEQARTAAAGAALEKALGHAVRVDVDAALTPRSASGLETQTASALEGLARYFSDLRQDGLALEFVRRKLVRVAAKYRAAEEHADASFDDETGTLLFTMREASHHGWLPSRYALDAAIDGALARDLERRFAKRTETSLSDDELEAYLRLLLSRPKVRTRAQSKEAGEEARAGRLLLLVRFEKRARGTPVHAEVEKNLARDVGFVLHRERQAPAFRELRYAYAGWVDERFFKMPKDERRGLYEALLGRTPRDEVCTSDPCTLLPELDRVTLALRFFTEAAPRDEGDFDAFDQALCVHIEGRDGKLERNRSCSSVYEFFLATEAHAERLVDALVRAKRREFLVAALANARERMPILLSALERRGGALHAESMRMVLDLDDYRLRDQRRTTLRHEATRLWPRRPDLRPLLLRILLEDYAASGRDDEAFARLGAEFGPIDAGLFARFLDEGPRSVELSPQLWPALKGVAAPFDVLAPRLDSFIAKRGVDAAKTIGALAKRACETRDVAGLRAIRQVLERRAKGGDKDGEKDRSALLLAARDCKAEPPSR
ncbi:MAG: hypothetical protein IPG50_19695 [Myxococcales bacterium]|nr:hypothetical protein [Myxococcales bacterium]